MAILTVNRLSIAGITDLVALLTAAAGGGDSFPATGNEFVYALNGSGGSITVTLSSNGAGKVCNFGATSTVHDQAVIIPAGKVGVLYVSQADLARFLDANGRVQITYSGVTSLSVGVFGTP